MELPLCHFWAWQKLLPLPLPPPACSLPGTSPFFSAHPMVTAGSSIMRLFGAGWWQRELGDVHESGSQATDRMLALNHTGPRAQTHQLLSSRVPQLQFPADSRGQDSPGWGQYSYWLPFWWLSGLCLVFWNHLEMGFRDWRGGNFWQAHCDLRWISIGGVGRLLKL